MRPWMLVAGLIAAAAVVALVVAVFLAIVIQPGPPITSARAGEIALRTAQAMRYNNRPVTGWVVDEVDWDPSGDVAFHMPNGGVERTPCTGLFGFGCIRRALWYVRLHAPVQADGSTHSAEVYVDARTGSVVGQGGSSFTGGGFVPPVGRPTPGPRG